MSSIHIGETSIGLHATEKRRATSLAQRGGGTLALLLLAVAGYMVPSVMHSDFYLGLANDGLVLGILALAAGFLMYQCNLVMFGIAALYGGPCYLFAIASVNWGWNPNASALWTVVATTLLAALIGIVIVRAKPLAFAMLTLAIGQMLRQLVLITSLRPITGGDDGIVVPFKTSFLGFSPQDLATTSSFWQLAWTATWILVVIVWFVAHSRFGLILRATRDNEERMRFSGFNTLLPRLAAFTLAGFIGSVAGTLHMLSAGFTSPELLDFSLAGNVLVSALVGGTAGVIGPVIGGVAFTLGLDQFAASGHLQLFTGAAVVIVIVALPRGAEGFVRDMSARFKHRAGS